MKLALVFLDRASQVAIKGEQQNHLLPLSGNTDPFMTLSFLPRKLYALWELLEMISHHLCVMNVYRSLPDSASVAWQKSATLKENLRGLNYSTC